MNKLKSSIQDHAFNETELLGRIRLQSSQQGRKVFFMRRQVWIPVGVAVAIVLILLLSLPALLPYLQQDAADDISIQHASEKAVEHQQAFAMVSVDINPSFEIYTDEAGLVMEIDPVNKDAKSLDTSALIGLPADQAVAGIIDLATKAGYIDAADDVDDYIVVSSVVLDDSDKNAVKKQEKLNAMLEKGLGDNKNLGEHVKVAIIKASQREMFEADGKDIPLGLYIINGMIESNGSWIKVSEFVSNADNLHKLANRAKIVGHEKNGNNGNSNGNNGNGNGKGN